MVFSADTIHYRVEQLCFYYFQAIACAFGGGFAYSLVGGGFYL